MNEALFNKLMSALEEQISRYNARHPRDRFSPNAVVIAHGPASSGSTFNEWFAEIKKTTAPLSSLKLEFPINAGAMKFRRSAGAQGIITLDIDGTEPVFIVKGERRTAEIMAGFLLELILAPDGGPVASKRKIGF